MNDARFLTLKEAARYIDQTPRWLRRWWPHLVQAGVRCYRVPKGSVKGRLVFEAASLEAYLRTCLVEPGSREFGAI